MGWERVWRAAGGRMREHDPQIVKAGWETASLNQQLEVLRFHLKSFKIWNRSLTHILKVVFFFFNFNCETFIQKGLKHIFCLNDNKHPCTHHPA